MDAAAEIGRNPVSKHLISRVSPSVENEQTDAGRDGRTRLARANLRRERGQINTGFPCSADHEQAAGLATLPG